MRGHRLKCGQCVCSQLVQTMHVRTCVCLFEPDKFTQNDFISHIAHIIKPHITAFAWLK